MNATAPNLGRLREFVGQFANLLASTQREPELLDRGGALLRDLVQHDDWLPNVYAEPDAARYRQYLLHCDSQQRFSVVSFVWGPGQATPIHDHTVWGLVGVLRGAELNEQFERAADRTLVVASQALLRAGSVSAVSPSIGDVHRVSNAAPDQVSISVHVYGANIGAVERSTYDTTGTPKRFVSGYANTHLPNLWDRSGAS
ncbi:MAG: hypothetical protein RL701_961 [Pseudomonadota bacterium]